MSRLIFMLEEASMKVLLDGLLPRLFPELSFQCIAHEGKSDLRKSLPRKLSAWKIPGDRFVVVQDKDGSDCIALKNDLIELVGTGGRPDTLVRIACYELESWYFGQPEALVRVFGDPSLRGLGSKSAYRQPDSIDQPSQRLAKLCPAFQKIGTARAMARYLDPKANRSHSFKVLIDGIARMSGIRSQQGRTADYAATKPSRA